MSTNDDTRTLGLQLPLPLLAVVKFTLRDEVGCGEMLKTYLLLAPAAAFLRVVAHEAVTPV